MPAKPLAAPFDVVPIMRNRKKKVASISVIKHAGSPYLPGLRSPYPFEANPPGIQSGLPDAISQSAAAARIAPTTCATMYGRTCLLAQRPAPHKPRVTAGLKCPPDT